MSRETLSVMVPGPAMPLLVWSGRLWKWCRTSFYLLNSNCKPKNIHGSRHMHSKPIFWKRSMWTSLDSKTEFPKNAYFLYTLLFGCSARPPLVILHCIWQEGACTATITRHISRWRRREIQNWKIAFRKPRFVNLQDQRFVYLLCNTPNLCSKSILGATCWNSRGSLLKTMF